MLAHLPPVMCEHHLVKPCDPLPAISEEAIRLNKILHTEADFPTPRFPTCYPFSITLLRRLNQMNRVYLRATVPDMACEREPD